MEQFYEQNVVNHNIDERTKRTRLLNILQMACIILAVFALMTCIMFIGSKGFIVYFAICASVACPFILGAVIINRINKRTNTEYDYTIDDETLKISAVYYRNRRKLKYNMKLRAIESVGVFDSEGYKKVEGRAQKKHLALVNYEDEDKIVYILYNSEKGRKIVFIEPDRGFVIALKRGVNAMTVFDKSISDFEKKLDKEDDA